MKLLSTAVFAIAGISTTLCTALAGNTQVCFEVPDDRAGSFPVSAGERFELEPSPSYIDGEEPGSRVNVRTGPGTEYPTNGIYGLVGEDITSIGFGYDTVALAKSQSMALQASSPTVASSLTIARRTPGHIRSLEALFGQNWDDRAAS